MILAPLLLLARTALAGVAYDPCDGPYPTEVFPLDGSLEVSPETVPAGIVNAECGTYDLSVGLAAGTDSPSTMTVPVGPVGIYWFTDLSLTPEASHVLTTDAGAWSGNVSNFITGSDPLPALEGTPSLSITGSSLPARSEKATVSLRLDLVTDPAGAIYELSRDGTVVQAGVDDVGGVDDLTAMDGRLLCYAITQLRADGSELGTSDEECVTLEQEKGCSTNGAPPSMLFAPLAVAMIGRRSRQGAADCHS